MNRQIVCYVRRSLISDWKRKVITHEERAFIFGSNDDRVFEHLEPGDVVWVVSPVPGRPPELIARLEVEVAAPFGRKDLHVGERLQGYFHQFKWIARGNQNSAFFGNNNAGAAILNSTFFNPVSGRRWKLADLSPEWKNEFGKRFIRPYPIEMDIPPGAHLFEEISKRPSIFISWKQSDHQTDYILSLAYALADQGFMPWLDLLAMPDSASLHKAQKHPKELDELLKYGYQRSTILLAVESEHYGEQSANSDVNWTWHEWEGALTPDLHLSRFIFCPIGSSPATKLPASMPRLGSCTPLDAAVELRKWVDGTG